MELYCGDLNFDGFPDLEIVSWHHENETGGEIYLWEQAKQRFSEEGIVLPRTYKVYEEQKVFTLGSVNEIICRLNANREIFWSNLPGSDEKIETYFSVDTEDYNISFMDLAPGEPLKLVISKGDHDVTISCVYQKEADYKSPEEFTAGTFTNLLGHNGFLYLRLFLRNAEFCELLCGRGKETDMLCRKLG